jgi:hypothetical protein
MANKKITELPLAITASRYDGSLTVLPIVISGTTNQISVENLSKFVTAYTAHTGSAGNTFKGPQTIQSTLSVTGNASVGGNLVVAGTLIAQEYYSEITSASIIYSEGSTIFGNTADDTHRFTGSIILNGGETLGNIGLNAFTASAGLQLNRIHQATASLQQFTASQDSRNFTLSQVTASFAGEIGGLEAYSASLKAAAIVSSSTQIQNYDVFALNSNLYIATGSIKGEIAGIEAYTASLKSQAIVSSSTQIQNYDLFALNSNLYNGTGSIKGEISGIEAYTASLKSAAIVSSSTQVQNYDLFGLNSNLYNATGSLIGITNGLMAYTSSNETWKTGVRAEINGIEAWTASLDNLYATDAQLYQLYQATRSLELHSGSMIGITNGLMAYTASNETWKDGVRGEVNGIESYTSSLKAAAIVSSSTQVQNYDLFALNSNLYTSTGSIKGEIAGLEAYTSSLKAAISISGTNVQIIGDLNVNKLNVQYISSSVLVTSGSNIFGDQSTDKHEFTGSVYLQNSLILGTEVLGNAGLNSSTASLIGITNGLMALTASMKAQAIVSSSTQIQNYDVFALNSNLYNGTGSIKGEIAGIEAYTASLKSATIVSSSNQLGEIAGLQALTASFKAAAIVSSSQQIQNYFTFARTGSANTFYGSQTINGDLNANIGSFSNYLSIGGTSGLNTYGTINIPTGERMILNSYHGLELKTSGGIGSGTPISILKIDAGGKTEITGSLSINTGNIVFDSGNGIDFSKTSDGSGTTTSELLNDYEEGTWTPVIRGSGTAGTYELTHISHYTKVGRMVTVSTSIAMASSITGGGSNYLQITGLPFTKAANTHAIGAVEVNGLDTVGNYLVVKFITVGASSILFLSEVNDNASPSDLPISAISALDGIGFTITYIV